MRDLGRGIIKLLDENTEHGFCLSSGYASASLGDGSPLVMHMAALDKYFSQHGRTWGAFCLAKGARGQ